METAADRFQEELSRAGVIVRDARMLELYQHAEAMALMGASILICGESGTGKDHFAKYIHGKSGRRSKPFVHLNCGAIPDTLFESELFGYEPGAFSGALSEGKPGLAELADGGTLYLDEIGEISPQNQVKLLQLLESGTLARLGGGSRRQVDLHIISATNRDLRQHVKQGVFRLDLYYRIKTMEVDIPPLRSRPQDILALLEHFEAAHGNPHQFSEEALRYLLGRPWVGNVREFQNFLEKMSLLEDPGPVTLEMLTDGKYRFSEVRQNESREKAGPKTGTLKEAVAAFEREYITDAIRETGTLTEAAKRLGLDLTTLNRKKKQLGIYKRRRKTGGEPPCPR